MDNNRITITKNMSSTGKKDRPKPPGIPRVSPVAHSAMISFEDLSSNLDSSVKTPERGQLLGIMRPVWTKVTESECRLTWLHEMVRQKLVVRNIE